MAFATRSLRVLCKIYNGTTGVTFSTFRQPSSRISLVQFAQKYCYTTDPPKRPKIAGSLTNIQATSGPAQALVSLAQETLDTKQTEEERKQEEAEEEARREHAKKATKYTLIFFGLFTSVGLTYVVYTLGRPDYDQNGNPIEDEFSHLPMYEQIYKRLMREFVYYKKFVQEPSRDKLLPDPLTPPYQQPRYTLVLEMKDVLVHPDWTYKTGWRWKKRPGVDKFLQAVAPPQFEVVVYTAEPGMTVFPILDALDPNGFIMYRLVRDSTRFVDGHHVKDLDCLNRDLSKVIVIDWNDESVKYHPENTLKIPRWTGNDDDSALFDLAMLLKTIFSADVDDVRSVLQYYRQFENPLEVFRENQRKLLTQLEEEEQLKAHHEYHVPLTSKYKRSFLRNR